MNLTEEDKQLIEAARKVIKTNYDDINWWHTVGAAVRTRNGNCYKKISQEKVAG